MGFNGQDRVPASTLGCATLGQGRHFMNNPGLFQARWKVRNLWPLTPGPSGYGPWRRGCGDLRRAAAYLLAGESSDMVAH